MSTLYIKNLPKAVVINDMMEWITSAGVTCDSRGYDTLREAIFCTNPMWRGLPVNPAQDGQRPEDVLDGIRRHVAAGAVPMADPVVTDPEAVVPTVYAYGDLSRRPDGGLTVDDGTLPGTDPAWKYDRSPSRLESDSTIYEDALQDSISSSQTTAGLAVEFAQCVAEYEF